MVSGGQAASELSKGDWDAVRGASDIQYAPLPSAAPPPQPPGWLQQLGEWLARLLSPVGELFGASWPMFSKILIGIAVIAALAIAWRLLAPIIQRARLPVAEAEPEWIPDRAEALALLEDADRLAAEGRYDEATHLLLRRSVGQIAEAKPDWIGAASTAREIAALPSLPVAARGAFATIARAVERSRYALSALTAEDWGSAREAYAAFALQRLAAA